MGRSYRTLLDRESLERNDRYRAIARKAAPGPIAAAEDDEVDVDDVDVAASPLQDTTYDEKNNEN